MEDNPASQCLEYSGFLLGLVTFLPGFAEKSQLSWIDANFFIWIDAFEAGLRTIFAWVTLWYITFQQLK